MKYALGHGGELDKMANIYTQILSDTGAGQTSRCGHRNQVIEVYIGSSTNSKLFATLKVERRGDVYTLLHGTEVLKQDIHLSKDKS